MSIIKGKYELSIWEDKLVEGEFKESKKCVIGSDKMQDAMISHRAYDIALTRNVNGSKSLTFKLAYMYTDIQTGQKVSNPFVGMLANETKIKLHQIDKNKWYDFIIKNISEDTKSHTCTYQAEDQFVNELSKNGFGVILDREKQNNINTNIGLAKEVLKDTDWEVDEENSDVNVQLQDEALYLIQIPASLNAKLIEDPDNEQGTIIKDETLMPIGENNYALAFYSSCHGKPKRFQFIYVDGTNPENENNTSYEVDEDGNIINEDCQYYIDNPTYDNETAQGLYLPAGITFTGTVLKKHRAKRYVFSTETDYFAPLDIYVQKVEKDGEKYNYYTESTYEAPTFITNIVSNNSFTNTSGWTGNCLTNLLKEKENEIVFGNASAAVLGCGSNNNDYSYKNNILTLNVKTNQDEVYYRFMNPTTSTNSLYNLKPNKSYMLSGKVRMNINGTLEDAGLVVRNQKHNGTNWGGDFSQTVLASNSTNWEKWQSFSVIFTVPSDAKGYYVSFQLSRNQNAPCEGIIQFKSLACSLVEKDDKTGEYTPVASNGDYDLAITAETTPNAIESLKEGTFNSTKTYTPYLKAKALQTSETYFTPLLIEDSFYANRITIESFKNGDKFVFAWRINGTENDSPTDIFNYIESIKVASWEHDNERSCYLAPADVYITITKQDGTLTRVEKEGEKDKTYIYNYAIGEVSNSAFTETQFKKSKVRTFFTLKENAIDLDILDFQIFKHIQTANSFMVPWDQSTEGTVITKHYYFNPADDDNKKVEKIGDLKTLVPTDATDVTFKPVIDDKCTKRREVSAKESNYFNILQSIAEKFECWLKIKLTRDDNGAVAEKKVLFKNYIGNNKRPGFRYGLNLKSIQRTNDSKAITTKLIVKTNSNELAKNGFCTIARAKANPTGETGLYDFSYYFNQGLLSKEDFLDEVNSIPPTTEINNLAYDNTQYYYYKLRRLNQDLLEKNNRLIEILPQKIDVQANLQIAEEGVTSAQEVYLEALEDFEELADFSLDGGPLTDEQIKQIEDNSDLLKYFTQAREALATKNTHERNKVVLTEQFEQIVVEQKRLEEDIATLTTNKLNLNKAFYKKYARFIQEGTWISEDYIDDEKYYFDAQSTLYNSCWPQVSYSITVANLENHEDYKGYTYDIGDQTYIQDPELFGYEKDGITPYRKDVVISEKTEYIDNPQKDTIKVQTFKNQFQDLFKAITATVQQVQYSTGAYQRAAELAVSDDRDRYRFLEGALNSAEMAIQNAGDQTVVWDSRGITITDSLNNAKQLRLVSGAIMFRTLDEKGDEVWKTGITPEGISADLITAGRLDAGLIQIMDKNHPSFRWDARGLTAYLETDDGYDTTSGVRFNSRGLFGFSNINNAHISEINEDNATFYLGRDGMRVQPSQFGKEDNGVVTNDYAIIGKVDDEVYNNWSSNGLPGKDGDSNNKKFVKIMEVGSIDDDTHTKSGVFTLYSDGTVVANNIKFNGSVGWAAAASPNQTVYHAGVGNDKTIPNRPVDGTFYNKFADSDGPNSTEWHKIKTKSDKYYSITTDGGTTWSVVYSLELDFTINSDTAFFVFNEDKKPAFDQTAIFVIQGEIPVEKEVVWKVNGNSISGTGKTQKYSIFSNTTYDKNEFIISAEIDGTRKEIKIPVTVQRVGKDAVNCYIESSVGFLIEQSETTQIATLTAKIYQGTEEIDQDGTELVYTWYVNDSAQTGNNTSGKTLQITAAEIKDKTVYFTAEEKSTGQS